MKQRKADARAGASGHSPLDLVAHQEPAVARISPLVFISHDSRDADLALAFDNLLRDASGGVVQTFRSSDHSGSAGIDYGENWYSKIAEGLSSASDVVALLTQNSIDRPWILFEAGFAVGRLDAKVFGIALGISLPKAVAGPFAQFQNCQANADSLTAVVLKLIRRNPSANPREEAVRRQVDAFLREIGEILKQRVVGEGETQEEINATAVAKLFEEVKLMFRDLSSRVESQFGGRAHRKRPRFHPMMVEELFHQASVEEISASAPWMLLASIFRETVPVLAEPALEIYRAIESGDQERVRRARANLDSTVRFIRRSRFSHFFPGEGDDEMFLMIRHLPELLEHFEELTVPDVKRSRPKQVSDDGSASGLEGEKRS